MLDSFSGPRWAQLLAQIAILIHMLTAYQVFGQAMFNTLESHVKWFLLKMEQRKDLKSIAEESGEIPAGDTSPSHNMPTPFDAAKAESDHSRSGHGGEASQIRKRKASMPTAKKSTLGLDHTHFNPLHERMSTEFSGAISERAHSAFIVPLQSAEILKQMPHGNRFSRDVAMFSVDTGFANEEVPLNDEGYVLPFLHRIVIRSIYVLIITLLACVMPFFSAFAGLVGAVTYFPLAIWFPFSCYRKLYGVNGLFSKILWTIFGITLFVAVVATVGSVRTIIVGWSTYTVGFLHFH